MLKPAVNGFSGGEMNVEILPGQGSHLHKARILGKCVVTGDLYAVECDALVLLDYMLQLAEDKAPLIQRVFPEMKSEDREFLISGISPEGWKRMHR